MYYVFKPSVIAHTCNFSFWEAGRLQVPGQLVIYNKFEISLSELYSEVLPQKEARKSFKCAYTSPGNLVKMAALIQ
jgi:hypothetical protein